MDQIPTSQNKPKLSQTVKKSFDLADFLPKRSYSQLPILPHDFNIPLSTKKSKIRDPLQEISDKNNILVNITPHVKPQSEQKPSIKKDAVGIFLENVRRSGIKINLDEESFVTVPGTAIKSPTPFKFISHIFPKKDLNLSKKDEVSDKENMPKKSCMSEPKSVGISTILSETQQQQQQSSIIEKSQTNQHSIESIEQISIQTPKKEPIKSINQNTQEKLKHQKDLFSQLKFLESELERREREQKEAPQIESAKLEEFKKLELELKVEQEENIKKRQSIEGLRDSVSILENKLESYEEHRRQMHKYIQQLRGNIRVFCRVKPFNSESEKSAIEFPELRTISVTKPKKLTTLEIGTKDYKNTYIYDRVFPWNSTQADIFEEVSPFLQSVLDGEKVCIFAYGQTGSGKTFTMEGPPGDELYENNQLTINSGILPRAGHYIFEEITRLSQKGYNYFVSCSALEIYNEELRDLMIEKEEQKNAPPQLAASVAKNEIEIHPLNWINIKDTVELMKAIKFATNNRKVEKTTSNERSSRSHFIFQIKLNFESNTYKKGSGLLNIIDLAGSERATKDTLVSKNENLMKEAKHINQSLTTLGRVLTMLADRKAKKTAIPYRESKLTRLLQNSLQSDSKTLVLVNICPKLENIGQSKESLRFANTASIAN